MNTDTMAIPVTAPVADDPAYRATVPRRLVHKHAVGDVFVTAYQPSPDGSASIAGELPRTHCYYSDLGGFPVRPDVMPLLELCRQACFVLAHRVHQVPIGWQFVLRTMSVDVFDPSAGISGEDAYDPLRVLVGCAERQRWHRKGELAGLDWRFDISAAHGGPFASATMALSWLTADKWAEVRARLRDRRGLRPEIEYRRPPLASVSAAAVGRENRRNVVITDVRHRTDTVEADLLVDVCHAGLFDHYNDHVPGMVEAEAARQAALLAAARSAGRPADRLRVNGLDLTFTQVGELDLRTACTARVDRRVRNTRWSVATRLAQAGEDIAHGSVRVTERAGDTQ